MRTRALAGALFVLVAATAMAASSAPPATAHDWHDYFWTFDQSGTQYWSRWDTSQVPFAIDAGYTQRGEQWTQRALDAAASWSSVPGSPMRLVYDSVVVAGTTEYCRDNPMSVVRAGSLPTGTSGLTSTCLKSRRSTVTPGEWSLDRFAVTVRTEPYPGYQWYTGAGSPPSDQQMDLQSDLTHEFGHALGIYSHFGDPGKDGTVCSTTQGGQTAPDDAATMCPQGGDWGTTWARTLSTHDMDTLTSAYDSAWPPPPTTTTMPVTTTTRPSSGGRPPDPPLCRALNGGTLSAITQCL